MATVWKAEDTLLGRTVALKLLSPSLVGSPEAEQRFVREARAASSLDHPSVVSVYDAGSADGHLFIAFACIEGETISDRVARIPMSDAEVIEVGIAVADALAHAHALGIVHRDITGRNIMVGRDHRVFVLDFGLAWVAGSAPVTSSRATLGTCAYLSPEVAGGGLADVRSDLYGLGVVLYEALTGRLPFTGDNAAATLYQVLQTRPLPPRRWRASIGADLEQVVLRLLEKQPGQRFASASELSRALRALREPGAAGVLRADMDRGMPADHPSASLSPADRPGERYLAVLPFADLGAADDDTGTRIAFARGLSWTLSSSLARHGVLRMVPVPASTASAPLEDYEGLARALGANLILHGNVRRSGMSLRVTYAIVQPFQRLQVSGDTLDASMLDLFALEDRLVASVLKALDVETTAARGAPRAAPRDPAAQERLIQALGYLQHHEDEAHVDAALGLLERLAASEPDTAAILAALGRACLLKYRLTAERVWESRAADATERAQHVDPASPEVALTLADLAVAGGHYEEAIEHYQRALAARPGMHDALIGMARAHEGLGRFDDAKRCCEEAIAMRPGYWAAHNELGFLYFREGRYSEALEPWRRVIALAPDNYRGHQNLGSSYFSLSQFGEALRWSQQSVEIRPNAPAYSNIGTIHFYEGRYELAAEMFKKALALRASDPLLWGNFGSACRWVPALRSQSREALEHAVGMVRERLERNPHKARDWVRLAGWLANLDRHEEARSALSRGLALAPDDVGALAQAGAICEQGGDRPQALQFLRMALQRGYGMELIRRDPYFAALCETPEFQALSLEAKAASSVNPSPDQHHTPKQGGSTWR